MTYINPKSGIYTITNKVNKKIYVGKAVNLQERINVHKSELRQNKHQNSHLQNSYNKYGYLNFEFEILEEYPKDLLCAMEHYWCNILKTHETGYNMGLTNPNCLSKISKISVQKRTNTRRKNAEKRGYWVHPDYCKKLSEQKKGKPVSSKMLERSKAILSKKVIRIDKEGNEVEYSSLNEASRQNNIFCQGISLVCNEKQETSGGFKWKFKSD